VASDCTVTKDKGSQVLSGYMLGVESEGKARCTRTAQGIAREIQLL